MSVQSDLPGRGERRASGETESVRREGNGGRRRAAGATCRRRGTGASTYVEWGLGIETRTDRTRHNPSMRIAPKPRTAARGASFEPQPCMTAGTREMLFLIGVWFKGIDGFLEVVHGVALLAVGPGLIPPVVRSLTQDEITEDPRDLMANALRHSARPITFASSRTARVFSCSRRRISW